MTGPLGRSSVDNVAQAPSRAVAEDHVIEELDSCLGAIQVSAFTITPLVPFMGKGANGKGTTFMLRG